MKNNIFLDGLRSVARVGETAVIAARAGIKYATEKPSNATLMRETFDHVSEWEPLVPTDLQQIRLLKQ